MTSLNFGSMAIEDQGDGPAIVMVHGLGGSSNSFQTLMQNLGEYRVLRPDLPGAGRSRYRASLKGISGLVSAVREVFAVAGIQKAHLVGHSLGTLVCQHMAAQSPEMVASLTLFGAMLEPPPEARLRLKERAVDARASGMAGIAEAVATASIADETHSNNPSAQAFVRESLMRQDPIGYAAHCEALSEAAAADHGLIQCPTMLIAGGHDSVTPVAMAQQLKANIRHAQLEVVAGAGHWIMVEDARRSTGLLRNHLEQVAG